MASNLSSSLNYSTISARSMVRVHPPAPLYKENYMPELLNKILTSNKIVPGVENTLTEGLINFMKEVK